MVEKYYRKKRKFLVTTQSIINLLGVVKENELSFNPHYVGLPGHVNIFTKLVAAYVDFRALQSMRSFDRFASVIFFSKFFGEKPAVDVQCRTGDQRDNELDRASQKVLLRGRSLLEQSSSRIPRVRDQLD